jgi:tripartite-type tricarboxylate transporter receptor subunit TctC
MTATVFIRALFAAALAATAARAQAPDEFYKGRQIIVAVYSGAGSTYDTYARVLAHHMSDHIPGKPTIVIQYMVGAGGLKEVDYLNRIAPRDGTVFGTIGRGLAFEQLLGQDNHFNPLDFTWLGSMNRENTMALSWNTSKVKTFDDLTKRELLVPGTGAGADSEIMPRAYNNLAGTRFKIISGYRDTSEAALQMETGELEGLAYWSWSSIATLHPDWIRDRKINFLFETGVKPAPEAPDVPRIVDKVADPVNKQAMELLLARETIGRPFLAPPGLPPARAKILRDAFAATMRDPAFIEEAARGNIEVDLVPGEEVDTLLKNSIGAPRDVVDRLKRALDR